MTIVTTSDFRTNMTKYLGMVDSGENVVLKSRKGSYSLKTVKERRSKPKRDITAEICRGLKEFRDYLDGKPSSIRTLDEFLDELRHTDNNGV